MQQTTIIVKANGTELKGIIDPARSPRTAQAFLDALPLTAHPVSWGGEVYFGAGFHVDDEHATSNVQVGDIAFWPPGDVLCIFFGRTPASTGDDPVPASPVNVIGTVFEAEVLTTLGPIGEVTIERG